MRSVHNNCEPRLETYVRSIFYSFDSLMGLCSPGVRGEPWSWWKTALMSSMGLNFYCTPLRFRNGEDKADITRPIQALLYDLRGVSLWYRILSSLPMIHDYERKCEEQGIAPGARTPPSESEPEPDVEELVQLVDDNWITLRWIVQSLSEENLRAVADQAMPYDTMLSIIDGALSAATYIRRVCARQGPIFTRRAPTGLRVLSGDGVPSGG